MDDMTEQQVSQLASIRGIRRVREVVSGLSSAQQEMLLKALPEWREQLQSERTASIPYRLASLGEFVGLWRALMSVLREEPPELPACGLERSLLLL